MLVSGVAGKLQLTTERRRCHQQPRSRQLTGGCARRMFTKNLTDPRSNRGTSTQSMLSSARESSRGDATLSVPATPDQAHSRVSSCGNGP